MSNVISAHPCAHEEYLRIPVLPAGLGRLMQTINDDDIGFRDIADVISQSPSIALRILGLANSAWSAPTEPITTLEAACGRLGTDVIRSVAMALAIAEVFNPAACPAFDANRYWFNSLLVAEAAALLADDFPNGDASQARTAGLLRSIGLLWLADSQSEETHQALGIRERQPDSDLDELLQAKCGFGYLSAGQRIAQHWQLPSEVSASAFHDCRAGRSDAPELAGLICQAARVAHGLGLERIGAEPPVYEDPHLADVHQRMHVRLERLEVLADQLCR